MSRSVQRQPLGINLRSLLHVIGRFQIFSWDTPTGSAASFARDLSTEYLLSTTEDSSSRLDMV